MTTQTMSASVDYKKWGLFALGVVALIALPSVAMAAGGLQGGLNTVKTQVETIKNAALTIGGIAAVIYLLWKAIQAWQGRCDWGEFGMSVAYVALAGAAATIAGWAWTLLQ